MLKSLSENGKGLYYFIENAYAIPKAFTDCLGGLISVVAQNIKLRFEPLSGTLIKRVLSKFTKQEETTETGETVYTINLGDLYSEEERNIICELQLPQIQTEVKQVKILQLNLEYFNVLNSNTEKAQSTLYIDRLENISLENKISNLSLDKQRNRILTADALEKANEFGKNANLEQARTEIKQAIERINQSVSVNEIFCQELIKDLNDALSRLKDHNSYVTSASKYMTSHTMSHNQQRGTHTTYSYATFSKTATSKAYDNEDDEVE